jgi:hypothetical protein
VLLQAALLVKLLLIQELLAPYRTICVPLKEQVPPSLAQVLTESWQVFAIPTAGSLPNAELLQAMPPLTDFVIQELLAP